MFATPYAAYPPSLGNLYAQSDNVKGLVYITWSADHVDIREGWHAGWLPDVFPRAWIDLKVFSADLLQI